MTNEKTEEHDTHAKARRILVTGATGFVGKALVPALVAEGYEVRATTRDSAREREREREEDGSCRMDAV